MAVMTQEELDKVVKSFTSLKSQLNMDIGSIELLSKRENLKTNSQIITGKNLIEKSEANLTTLKETKDKIVGPNGHYISDDKKEFSISEIESKFKKAKEAFGKTIQEIQEEYNKANKPKTREEKKEAKREQQFAEELTLDGSADLRNLYITSSTKVGDIDRALNIWNKIQPANNEEKAFIKENTDRLNGARNKIINYAKSKIGKVNEENKHKLAVLINGGNYKYVSIDAVNKLLPKGQQGYVDENELNGKQSLMWDILEGKTGVDYATVVKTTIGISAISLLGQAGAFGAIAEGFALLASFNPVVAACVAVLGAATLIKYARQLFAPEIKKLIARHKTDKQFSQLAESEAPGEVYASDEEVKKFLNEYGTPGSQKKSSETTSKKEEQETEQAEEKGENKPKTEKKESAEADALDAQAGTNESKAAEILNKIESIRDEIVKLKNGATQTTSTQTAPTQTPPKTPTPVEPAPESQNQAPAEQVVETEEAKKAAEAKAAAEKAAEEAAEAKKIYTDLLAESNQTTEADEATKKAAEEAQQNVDEATNNADIAKHKRIQAEEALSQAKNEQTEAGFTLDDAKSAYNSTLWDKQRKAVEAARKAGSFDEIINEIKRLEDVLKAAKDKNDPADILNAQKALGAAERKLSEAKKAVENSVTPENDKTLEALQKNITKAEEAYTAAKKKTNAAKLDLEQAKENELNAVKLVDKAYTEATEIAEKINKSNSNPEKQAKIDEAKRIADAKQAEAERLAKIAEDAQKAAEEAQKKAQQQTQQNNPAVEAKINELLNLIDELTAEAKKLLEEAKELRARAKELREKSSSTTKVENKISEDEEDLDNDGNDKNNNSQNNDGNDKNNNNDGQNKGENKNDQNKGNENENGDGAKKEDNTPTFESQFNEIVSQIDSRMVGLTNQIQAIENLTNKIKSATLEEAAGLKEASKLIKKDADEIVRIIEDLQAKGSDLVSKNVKFGKRGKTKEQLKEKELGTLSGKFTSKYTELTNAYNSKTFAPVAESFGDIRTKLVTKIGQIKSSSKTMKTAEDVKAVETLISEADELISNLGELHTKVSTYEYEVRGNLRGFSLEGITKDLDKAKDAFKKAKGKIKETPTVENEDPNKTEDENNKPGKFSALIEDIKELGGKVIELLSPKDKELVEKANQSIKTYNFTLKRVEKLTAELEHKTKKMKKENFAELHDECNAIRKELGELLKNVKENKDFAVDLINELLTKTTVDKTNKTLQSKVEKLNETYNEAFGNAYEANANYRDKVTEISNGPVENAKTEETPAVDVTDLTPEAQVLVNQIKTAANNILNAPEGTEINVMVGDFRNLVEAFKNNYPANRKTIKEIDNLSKQVEDKAAGKNKEDNQKLGVFARLGKFINETADKVKNLFAKENVSTDVAMTIEEVLLNVENAADAIKNSNSKEEIMQQAEKYHAWKSALKHYHPSFFTKLGVFFEGLGVEAKIKKAAKDAGKDVPGENDVKKSEALIGMVEAWNEIKQAGGQLRTAILNEPNNPANEAMINNFNTMVDNFKANYKNEPEFDTYLRKIEAITSHIEDAKGDKIRTDKPIENEKSEESTKKAALTDGKNNEAGKEEKKGGFATLAAWLKTGVDNVKGWFKKEIQANEDEKALADNVKNLIDRIKDKSDEIKQAYKENKDVSKLVEDYRGLREALEQYNPNILQHIDVVFGTIGTERTINKATKANLENDSNEQNKNTQEAEAPAKEPTELDNFISYVKESVQTYLGSASDARSKGTSRANITKEFTAKAQEILKTNPESKEIVGKLQTYFSEIGEYVKTINKTNTQSGVTKSAKVIETGKIQAAKNAGLDKATLEALGIDPRSLEGNDGPGNNG